VLYFKTVHELKKVITSICREGMFNSWIEADDTQIKKRQWPRGAKDIYILFLRQEASK